jgi:hypothetical protein
MANKLNLKTKSLYIGCYENPDNFILFVANSNMADGELEDYFCNVIYKGEYGAELDKDDLHGVYQIRSEYDYLAKKFYKISVQ